MIRKKISWSSLSSSERGGGGDGRGKLAVQRERLAASQYPYENDEDA